MQNGAFVPDMGYNDTISGVGTFNVQLMVKVLPGFGANAKLQVKSQIVDTVATLERMFYAMAMLSTTVNGSQIGCEQTPICKTTVTT